MILDIDLHFELAIPFDNPLTLGVFQALPFFKLKKERLGNISVGHGVARHHELIEVILLGDDVCLHTQVIDEVKLDRVAFFLWSKMLLFNDLEASIILHNEFLLLRARKVKAIRVNYAVPVVLNQDIGVVLILKQFHLILV